MFLSAVPVPLAYETLGNRTKRRSYDSVDPSFDNAVPPVSSNSKENFFREFRDVFERNSRSVCDGH